MSQLPILKRSSDISRRLSEILSTITVANGYQTDIGTRVFRGKWKHDEDAVPYSVVFEGEDDVPPGHSNIRDVAVRQEFILAGYVECDPDDPNDAADAVIADIKRAVFTSDLVPAPPAAGNRGIGVGRVKQVSYMGKKVGPRSDGAERAYVFGVVQISILFAEDLLDA